eukprot:gene8436-262_t
MAKEIFFSQPGVYIGLCVGIVMLFSYKYFTKEKKQDEKEESETKPEEKERQEEKEEKEEKVIKDDTKIEKKEIKEGKERIEKVQKISKPVTTLNKTFDGNIFDIKEKKDTLDDIIVRKSIKKRKKPTKTVNVSKTLNSIEKSEISIPNDEKFVSLEKKNKNEINKSPNVKGKTIGSQNIFGSFDPSKIQLKKTK